jgi:hypothetical protein
MIDSPSSTQSPRRSIPIVPWLALLVLSVAIFLLLRRPIVFMSNLRPVTGIVYAALALGWIALLILAAVRTANGSWRLMLPLLFTGAVLFLCSYIVFGPTIGAIVAAATGERCTEPEQSGDQISMRCMAGSDEVTFEGRQGSPIMWMVDN